VGGDSKVDWRARCAEAGLDENEVRRVSERYDMYRSYTDAQGAEPLGLSRWYHWYRVEKLSEGHAMAAPPAAGCSVEPGVGDAGPIISERDFLALLQHYRTVG